VPDFNPFAPTIEVGATGGGTVGDVGATVTGGGRFSAGRLSSVATGQDNHYAAAILLLAIIIIWALYQSKFRFSMTVG